ncbi:MAG: DUF4190 domain-containing protein [Salibacteraceae bacterium]
MKRATILKMISFLLVLAVTSSCSIEKRKHMSGYHIDFKRKHNVEQAAVKDSNAFWSSRLSNVKNNVKQNQELLIASSQKGLHEFPIRLIQPIKIEQRQWKDDSVKCDRLTFKNGDEMAVKVVELTTESVKYRKCKDEEGPLFSVPRNELFMIVYADGKKELIKEEEKFESYNSNTPENISPSTEPFAIASLVTGILSLLFFWTGWALLLGVFAIIAGAISLNKIKKSKGKLEGAGMAKAGIITASVAFFLVILAIVLVIAYFLSYA